MKPSKPPPPERTRKTPADLLADLAADHQWDSAEYRALVAAGLRAPAMLDAEGRAGRGLNPLPPRGRGRLVRSTSGVRVRPPL